jgi:hypothetical protein
VAAGLRSGGSSRHRCSCHTLGPRVECLGQVPVGSVDAERPTVGGAGRADERAHPAGTVSRRGGLEIAVRGVCTPDPGAAAASRSRAILISRGAHVLPDDRPGRWARTSSLPAIRSAAITVAVSAQLVTCGRPTAGPDGATPRLRRRRPPRRSCPGRWSPRRTAPPTAPATPCSARPTPRRRSHRSRSPPPATAGRTTAGPARPRSATPTPPPAPSAAPAASTRWRSTGTENGTLHKHLLSLLMPH